jgi:transposase
MGQDNATALLGLAGLRVTDVETTADATTVHARTEPGVGTVCPDCQTLAQRCKEEVTTRPRDLPYAGRSVMLVWHKRRWYCEQPACPRKTFTESVPSLPPRQRLTTRMRAELGAAVADSGRTVAEVSATHHVAWRTTHRAFVAHVDPRLSAEPEPVTYLGIDEVRRGAPRWSVDPDTGESTQLADRWHVGFTDLSGEQGLLGSVEGRDAKSVTAWLAARSPQWRAGVRVVAIDMCAAFRRAVRLQLPNAKVCVDPFHLVQLANKMVSTVRWRVVRERYGRRTRKGDPEYGIKRLLMRNLEELTPQQLSKLWNTMVDEPGLADLHVAWIVKETLRDLLALRITRAHTTPCPSQVRDRWTTLLTWCADNARIPELKTFARTLDTWRQEIINSVLIGASNAASEGVNRIQKLDARKSAGYRNPDNQRRRARVATLRSVRRLHSRRTPRLWTIGPPHRPG